MAKAPWELGACVNCTTFTPDGELIFVQGGECGISAVTVGPLHINKEYPKVAKAVESCTGPLEKEVRRRGLLGRLGATETVRVCPAITEEQLQGIFKDQIEWHEAMHAKGEI